MKQPAEEVPWIPASSARSIPQHPLLLPVVIALAALAVLAYFERGHLLGTYETETDFYQFYGPDAERLRGFHFPENSYQGPGYPALLALLSTLNGDTFETGKWLSILSAGAALMMVFWLWSDLLGYWVGIGAELLLAVSGPFPMFASSAATDVFFLSLCLGVLLILMAVPIDVRLRVLVAALLTGAAYLTRYNGVFLVVASVFAIVILDLFRMSLRDRLNLSALFVTVVIVTGAPWFYENYRHHGSPFYNANYLNMATLFYGELVGGRADQDATRQLTGVFHSFGDVLCRAPRQVLLRYSENLYQSFVSTLGGDLVSPWLGTGAMAGLVFVLVQKPSKEILFVLASALFYGLLMGLNHWESRYYLFVVAVYGGLATYAVSRPVEVALERGWRARHTVALLAITLFAATWLTSATFSFGELRRVLSAQAFDVIDACDYLKRHHVTNARIVSRKPHLPYLCNQQWVFFPPVKSLVELRGWLRANPAEYLTFGEVELIYRPELGGLMQPSGAPGWLKPVSVHPHPRFVLYEISPR